MTVNNVSQTKGERMKRARWLWLAAVLMLALIGAGCGGGNEESSGGTVTSGGAKDKVTLQLKWVTQAQFAGYYAAKAQGYYDDEGLDVDIKVGGPDIVPEQVVLGGQAEFGIDWLDNLLATRDQNGDIVNIAQVFARSGMTEVTWKDSGLDSIASLKGKKGRRLAWRQRAQALRRAEQERHRPAVRRRGGRAAVRHEPVPEPGGRRRRGDDLQRACAGARAGES
jgi:hypothetical protein